MNFKERYKYDPEKDLLGKGGFSKVFKAYDQRLDRYVALKFFTSTAGEKYNVLSEIKKMVQFQHKSIVRFFDVEEVQIQSVHGEQQNIHVGIMEFINSGDLYAFLKTKPDAKALKQVVKGILEGLEFIHSKNIIHRDIKPQNIFMHREGSEWIPKIGDFGISKELDKGQSGSSALLGTVEYMAPEQFNPDRFGTQGKLTTNVDIWSFGVILLEMFSGDPFFGKRSAGISMEHIMRNIYEKPLPVHFENVPEPYQSIIKRCLVKNAPERVQGARELIAILESDGASAKVASPSPVREKTPLTPPVTSTTRTTASKATSAPVTKSSTSSVPASRVSSELKWKGQQTQSGRVAVEKKTNPLVFIIPVMLLLIGVGIVAFFVLKPKQEIPSSAENLNVIPDTPKTEQTQIIPPERNITDPKFNELYFAGNTERAKGNYKEAIVKYKEALKLKPDDKDVQDLLRKTEEQLAKQEDWKKQQTEMNTQTTKALFDKDISLGKDAMKRKEFDAAIQKFQSALVHAQSADDSSLVDEKINECEQKKQEQTE